MNMCYVATLCVQYTLTLFVMLHQFCKEERYNFSVGKDIEGEENTSFNENTRRAVKTLKALRSSTKFHTF